MNIDHLAVILRTFLAKRIYKKTRRRFTLSSTMLLHFVEIKTGFEKLAKALVRFNSSITFDRSLWARFVWFFETLRSWINWMKSLMQYITLTFDFCYTRLENRPNKKIANHETEWNWSISKQKIRTQNADKLQFQFQFQSKQYSTIQLEKSTDLRSILDMRDATVKKKHHWICFVVVGNYRVAFILRLNLPWIVIMIWFLVKPITITIISYHTQFIVQQLYLHRIRWIFTCWTCKFSILFPLPLNGQTHLRVHKILDFGNDCKSKTNKKTLTIKREKKKL